MTKRELSALKEVRDMLTMSKERFSEGDRTVVGKHGAPDTTVVEATRIWRETWILPPLDRIIRKYDPTWTPDGGG